MAYNGSDRHSLALTQSLTQSAPHSPPCASAPASLRLSLLCVDRSSSTASCPPFVVSAAVTGSAQLGPISLPFVGELGLSVRDEQLAFCTLYGAWLGAGSLTGEGHLNLSAYSEADVALYHGLFHRLQRVLPEGQWRRRECDSDQDGTELHRPDGGGEMSSVDNDELSERTAVTRCAEHCRQQQQQHSSNGRSHPSHPLRQKLEQKSAAESDVKAASGETVPEADTNEKRARVEMAANDSTATQPSDSGSSFSSSRRPVCAFVIVHRRWCRYFGEQYGHRFWGEAPREAAVAGAARRGSQRPAARCGPHFYDSQWKGGDRSTQYERQQPTNPADGSSARLSASPSFSTASTDWESEPSTPYSSDGLLDKTTDSHEQADEEDVIDAGIPGGAAIAQQPAVEGVPTTRQRLQPVTMPAVGNVGRPATATRRPPTISTAKIAATALTSLSPTVHKLTENEEAVSASERWQFREPSSPQPPDAEDIDGGAWLWWWVLLCCDDREMLRAIIAGYSQANGALSTSRTQLLLTTSARLRDELVLLCLHAGYSAIFRLEQSPAARHGSSGSIEPAGSRAAVVDQPVWSVWYSDDERLVVPVLQSGRDIKRSSVRGRVWCLTVPPHHLVLARSVLERDVDGGVVSASRPVIVGQCYQNALKKDPQNVQILKDLSQLQIQRRMADGYCETRRQLLMLKTNNRGNWLAYAIGHHLAGRHSKAIDIIDSFMRTQDSEEDSVRRKKREREREEAAVARASKSADDLKADTQRELAAFSARSRVRVSFEDSELHLYRLSLLSESKQWQAAWDYLDDVQLHIADSLCYTESRAMLLLELGRTVEAEQYYRALLAINPDNAAYHYGLHRSLGLSVDERADSERLRLLYAELQSDFPKSSLVRRLPLDFCHDESFASLVAQHMKHFIRKAIPSLFADMQPLYRDKLKVRQIEATVEAFITQLQDTHTFDASSGQDEDSPSCLLWTLIFAAQHFDHLGQPHTHTHTHTHMHIRLLQPSQATHTEPVSHGAACWSVSTAHSDHQPRVCCIHFKRCKKQSQPHSSSLLLTALLSVCLSVCLSLAGGLC